MTELDKKLGLTPLSKKLEKEHWERVKKYKKIFKEKGCIHWLDSSDLHSLLYHV